MHWKLSLGIATAVLAAAFGGAAMAATLPDGQKSGSSPQSSGALVTMAFPGVIGMNVAHNFVLVFNSGTKCWGTSSSQGTFPQAASGNTANTFAVTATPYDPAAQNVVCPSAGAQPDLASVQILNTSLTNSSLQTSIEDDGWGAQATALTNLIADIFSASRLKVATSDGCGGGSVPSSHAMAVAAADYVTGISRTAWSDCNQKLSLTLASTMPVATGTATGTLTFTISNP